MDPKPKDKMDTSHRHALTISLSPIPIFSCKEGEGGTIHTEARAWPTPLEERDLHGHMAVSGIDSCLLFKLG